MKLNACWAKFKTQHLPTPVLRHVLSSALFLLLLLGCVQKKIKPFTPEQVSDAIKTVRGRAKIQIKEQDHKLSFIAAIVIDRRNLERQKLRLEAMDPFGTVHLLLILDERGVLTWVNFDEQKTSQMHDTWKGLPLNKLPELFLGISPLSDLSYEVQTSDFADSSEYFVPYKIKILSPDHEINLIWSERKFNEDVPSSLFQAPRF